jgi:hypothetical protein
MSPEAIVRAVFDRVHASDPTVADLYAEDAVRIDQVGRRFEGRAAISGFYTSIFPTPAPHPVLEQLFVNQPFVAALLRRPGVAGEGARYLDLFEVQSGLIQTLWVMFEPAGPV